MITARRTCALVSCLKFATDKAWLQFLEPEKQFVVVLEILE